MKKLDMLANEFAYGDIVKVVAEKMNVDLVEARSIVANMSFADHRKIHEANGTIVPPSGNTIAPTSQPTQNQQASNQPPAKATWTGKGPINIGMTVGLKGPNGVPVPGEVSKVDMGANGVTIKDPTTGKDQWMNIQDLQPFMAQAQAGQQSQPTAEDVAQLSRLRELAGIKENCSAGATGAGAIAIAPAAMGTVKKRQYPEESLKKEYTPRHSAETIAGDTKPAQASGELSANLAASGKKSAGRINNGKKRPQ